MCGARVSARKTKMKIITVGNGFVASHLPYQVSRVRFDNGVKSISKFLEKNKPDVVINCVGKTGRPNMDWCEINKGETTIANVALPVLLAQECAKKSIRMIHVGSGCIFYGSSPYVETAAMTRAITKDHGWRETDIANPQSHYSKTKYACDLAIGGMENVTILRIRMPISKKNHPRNLITELRGYNKVINVPNSMTFMDDFVRCVDWIVSGNKTGIYHVTNPGVITAAQIMGEYKKHNADHAFSMINEEQLTGLTIAKRSNCVLDSSKLKGEGFEMTPASDALKDCMIDYVRNV